MPTEGRSIVFNGGPAKLPDEVIKECQINLMNLQGYGLSILEMSHRSPEFLGILKRTEELLRELVNIPSNYKVLFMHGGATGQFAGIPMNISKGPNGTVDYMVAGTWASKAAKEAEKYTKVNLVFPKTTTYTGIPDKSQWKFDPNAAYVYYTDNETIHGIEYPEVPSALSNVTVCCDMTSNFLTRPFDVTKYGAIIASTQKNCGIAGMAIVIVREDLFGHALTYCPGIFDWKITSDNGSNWNTPPCFQVYMTELFLKWIKSKGGLKEMDKRSKIRSKLIYDVIDNSNGFYYNAIDKNSRSRVVIPFRVGGTSGDDALEKKFLEQAKAEGMVGLKGHRLVGGIRASMFNAMEIEEAEKLKDFMMKFQNENRK